MYILYVHSINFLHEFFFSPVRALLGQPVKNRFFSYYLKTLFTNPNLKYFLDIIEFFCSRFFWGPFEVISFFHLWVRGGHFWRNSGPERVEVSEYCKILELTLSLPTTFWVITVRSVDPIYVVNYYIKWVKTSSRWYRL